MLLSCSHTHIIMWQALPLPNISRKIWNFFVFNKWITKIKHWTDINVKQKFNTLGTSLCRRSKSCNCIHFFFQKKGINEYIKILSLHHIFYVVICDTNSMISYTALRIIVCSDAFRSVPTTNLYNLKLESIQKEKKKVEQTDRIYKEISSLLPALIEALIDYFEVWAFPFHIALHTVPWELWLYSVQKCEGRSSM
jgi:hypothetical protein